jgi:hypothetical protein
MEEEKKLFFKEFNEKKNKNLYPINEVKINNNIKNKIPLLEENFEIKKEL